MNWCAACGRELIDGQCSPCQQEQGERLAARQKLFSSLRVPTRVAAIGPVQVKLSRQSLRRLGRAKTSAEVKAAEPLLTRKQRRKVAKTQHATAWGKRDRELVRKIHQGMTPQPKPLAINVTKI